MIVTITGADDHVDPAQLYLLSDRFPFVEWGLLHSEKRAGTLRYPSGAWIEYALRHLVGVRVAVHLCGAAARAALSGEVRWHSPEAFHRVQINGFETGAKGVHEFPWCEYILQARSASQLEVCAKEARRIGRGSVLLDLSGGTGKPVGNWCMAPPGVRMGLAGGINLGNVEHAMVTAERCNASWIDLETGARDENDRFSLSKVYDILAAVEPFILEDQ